MNKPVISIIVTLLSLAFAFFYARPMYMVVEERRADLASLVNTLNNSSKIKSLISQTTDNLASVNSGDMARFAVLLPESIDEIRVSNNIQHIGLINKIVLEGIKVERTTGATLPSTNTGTGAGDVLQGATKVLSILGAPQQPQTSSNTTSSSGSNASSGYVTIKISFTFTATNEAFQLFLNDLEKSLGLINVTSLAFAPASSSGDTTKTKIPVAPTYQYSMTIETYSLK